VPLPKPSAGETRKKFISRCMGDEQSVKDFPDPSQRNAVCNSIFEDSGKARAMPRRYYGDLIGKTIYHRGGLVTESIPDIKADKHDSEEDKKTKGQDGKGDSGTREGAKPGGKLKNFNMVAYTGVEIKQPFASRLVLDLEGMELPAAGKLPTLTLHDQSKVVGHGSASITENILAVSGVVSGTGEAAKEIQANSANGFPYQSSMGADILRLEEVEGGASVEVNGQKFEGPILVVRGSFLREVSFVPAGADADTSANVAASMADYQEGYEMNFEKWLEANGFKDVTDEKQLKALRAAYEAGIKAAKAPKPEPKKDPAPEPKKDPAPVDVQAAADLAAQKATKTERERIAAIREACGGDFDEIQAEAESGGWTVEATNAKLIVALRETRPNVNPRSGSKDAPGKEILEAGLYMRAGIANNDKELVKEYGEAQVEAASKTRNLSIKEVMKAGLHLDGVDTNNMSEGEIIQAAASTSSVPGILGNVANKRMLKNYNLQNITATILSSTGDLADFKEHERFRLNDIGDIAKVGPDGEIKHGTVSEEKATNQLETFGKRFELTRTMIINDDLGAFLQIPAALGARAAQKIDKLFYERLLANNIFPAGGANALFSAGNNNFVAGVATALDGDAMDQALQLLLDQVDADGQPISVNARFLLVPTALNFTAKELTRSSTVFAVGSTDKERIPTFNPILDENLTVIVSPWLSNSTITGNSSKAWYLFGDPNIVDTFEVGFLRGARTPTIERFDAVPSTLGMVWRIFFDIGIREQDFRGMVKMKGEA